MKLDQISKACDKYGIDTSSKLDALRIHVEGLAKRLSRPDTLSTSDDGKLADKLAMNLISLGQHGHYVAKQQAIIGSLWFPTILSRHDQIPEAHRKTFEWIYDPGTTVFAEWLKTGDGIFWISGKAGSGKSTLMKYMANEEQTISALTSWAGEKQLVTASFYFWNPGTKMQKSTQGLLQSLLYEILRKCPDLIPKVVPDRWQGTTLFAVQNRMNERLKSHIMKGPDSEENVTITPETWSIRELKRAFSRLQRQSNFSTKFCFFVDGLDEYGGDHHEAITLLQELVNAQVKICVSSRPWNIFQLAFGRASDKHLLLELLTKKDIEGYVRAKLGENDIFVQACEIDQGHKSLVDQIVERAEGVWLWVTLALRSLLNGISNADTIPELRKRLEDLPEDLGNLFNYILQTIEPRYKEQAIAIFRVALRAEEPLPLLVFPHTEEASMNQLLSRKQLQRSDVITQLQTAWRRVNARCNGLLHVYVTESEWTMAESFIKEEAPVLFQKLRVNFIHRSVREFLTISLGSSSNSSLELSRPLHEICTGFLRVIRCIRSYQGLNIESLQSHLQDLILDVIKYAKLSEGETGKPETEVLDGLRQSLYSVDGLFTLNPEKSSAGPSVLEAIPYLTNDGMKTRNKAVHLLWFSLEAGLISYNVRLYIEEKIDRGSPGFSAESGLLDLIYIAELDGSHHSLQIASKMVEKYGLEQLNHPVSDLRMFHISTIGTEPEDNDTPWSQNPRTWKTRPTLLDAFIFLIRHDNLPHVPAQYPRLLEALLVKGANPNATVEGLVLWIESCLSRSKPSSHVISPLLSLFLNYGADPNLVFFVSALGYDRKPPRLVRAREPNTPWGLFLVWLHRRFVEAIEDNGPSAKIDHWGESFERFLQAGADSTLTIYIPDAKGAPKTVVELSLILFSEDALKRILKPSIPSNPLIIRNTNVCIAQGAGSAESDDDEWFSAEDSEDV